MQSKIYQDGKPNVWLFHFKKGQQKDDNTMTTMIQVIYTDEAACITRKAVFESNKKG